MEGVGGGMSKPEGERWLEIAERLLSVRDLAGSKKFAARAHESDPNLEGVDQIVTVADVLIAAEKRINNHMDWYAILQLDHRTEDLEYMKRQFRRLALLLHPDKNKSPFADNAFKLVSDAYTVLSDPSKKNLYDNELNLFLKFDPVSLNNNNHHHHHHHQLNNPQTQTQAAQTQQAPTQQQQETTPVRRSTREKRKAGRTTTAGSGGGGGSGTGQNNNNNNNNTHPPKADTRAPPLSSGPGQSKMSSFWTACPYCYNLYEYPRVYEECCLRCQNCRRAFHAAVIPSPPPIVPGEDAYYCCWAFFPLGYQVPSSGGGGNKNTSTPNWTPFSAMYSVPGGGQPGGGGGGGGPPKYGSDKDDDDDDDVMDVSDGSWDSDAEDGSSRKKGKSADVKKNASGSRITRSSQGARLNKADGNVSAQGTQDGTVVRGYEGTAGAQKNMKKRAVAKKSVKQYGKAGPVPEIVDLNAAVKNEDDPSHMGEGVAVGGGNEDPIAGIGFFEGLDEILGHLGGLPILSVPEVQKAAEGAQ